MQLEAGKKYTDRRGRVYGPLVTDSQFFAEQFGCQLWYTDGLITPGKQYDMDLVAEYVEPVQPESWYLHRDCNHTILRVSDGRVTYFEDGIKGGSYCEKERAYILGEKITAEDASARIAAQVNPAVMPAPVESPDDWVILDPVVYADHELRKDIDWIEYGPGWRLVNGYAGTTVEKFLGCDHHCGVRCRRKDLPPVPPKTRTVVLKEWICWDDDGPVVTLWQDIDPTDGEIDYNNFHHAVATGETRTVEIPVT